MSRKIILFFLILFSFFNCVLAEQNILIYNGTENYNIAYDVSVDTNYIYVVGQVNGEIGFYDALIMKLDKNLNVVNKTIYGRNSTFEYFYGVTNDLSSVYATGVSNGSILTVKFDKDLNIINKTEYGLSGHMGYSITTDSNFVYVAGEIFGVIGSTRDNNGILKYDKDLNLINETVYGISTSHENAEAICVDDDFVYVLGETYSDVASSYNWLFLKLDKNLSKNLSFAFAHTYTNNDNPHDMIIDGDYIYSIGDGFVTASRREMFIVKMDKNFSIIEQVQIGNTVHVNGNSIISDSNYIYALGRENNDILIVKLDKNLNIINKTVFSGGIGTDIGYSIKQDSSFLYIVGETKTLDGVNIDIFIFKLHKDLDSNLVNYSNPAQFTYRLSNSSISTANFSIATSSRTYTTASLAYGISNLNYTISNLSLNYYNIDFYYQTLLSNTFSSSVLSFASFFGIVLSFFVIIFYFFSV